MQQQLLKAKYRLVPECTVFMVATRNKWAHLGQR